MFRLLLWVPLMAGCASDGPPRLPGADEPIAPSEVRSEPLSPAGNRSPYRVLGKTYHVLADARGFEQTGIASWYGRKFHGRTTANGERYDMYRFTAAHRALPLPTWVRVTNLANGRALDVRVNDRGPFHDDRIIDLSYAAARALGFADGGTTRVHIEVIAAPTPPPAATVQSAPPRTEGYWLQAGAFLDAASADALSSRLRAVLDHEAPVTVVHEASLHRVRVGPFDAAETAERFQFLLMAADFGVPLMVEDVP